MVNARIEKGGCGMRNEQEMFDLILGFARQDKRVRAVILDGSRADPEVAQDLWQDYDIVYVVTDVDSFKSNPDWINVFGERMILQLPDEMGESAKQVRPGYCYLMQFMDGTRIDLTLYPVDRLSEIKVDSYRCPLLDKDNILPAGMFRNLSGYYPKPPTSKEYEDCCNEFWWCSPYVARGLWRGEILYAHHMLDEVVRGELMKMLVWFIGIRTGFHQNPGKYGKRFKNFLPPELWQILLKTYASSEIEATWDALFQVCRLFRLTAPVVAEYFGYAYSLEEDERVFAFLDQIKATPTSSKIEDR
jgi:aminoglycoside 6-adenylyltransferase